ncbi:MAG: acyl carrier protein [Lachnospiraceae bacterium]|mgnify:FL=1|nr:acyl carrier protein [Candidatus Hippenecus merdae]MCQ2414767.1 acyl carrier protein [Lachnospiraceae bacterium]
MEFEKLAGIIAEVMNIDPKSITEDTDLLKDLGADSLDIMQILMNAEEVFDIEIPDDEELLSGISTVGDALKLLEDRK